MTGHTAIPPPPTRNLLGIPSELRLKILDASLPPESGPHNMSPSSLSLLLVCKKIHEEAYEVLLRRPATFSLCRFIEWTSRVGPSWLRFLKNLTLTTGCDEKDCKKLRNYSYDCTLHPTSGEYWQRRYLQIAHNITPITTPGTVRETWRSLSPLDLDRLVVTFTRRHTFEAIVRPEVETLIEMISHATPNLQELSLQTPLFNVTLLENLKNLRHLEFPGYSLSDSQTTLSVLQGLPKLDSLSLCDRDLFRTSVILAHQSVDEAVFWNIKPLSSLRMTHVRRITGLISKVLPSPIDLPPFLSAPIMKAVLVKHRDSLLSLSLTRNFALSREEFEVILKYLPLLTKLETLKMDFEIEPKEPGDVQMAWDVQGFNIRQYVPATVTTLYHRINVARY